MTPTYLNSSSPFSFPVEQYHDDLHHDHPIIISPNKIYNDGHGASASSCDLPSFTFSNSSSPITQDDRRVFCHKVLQQASVQQDQADDYDFQGGLHRVESYSSSSNDKELKLSIWEKENMFENHHQWYHESTSTCSKLKWMSTNMRLTQKVKNDNIYPTVVNPTPSATTLTKPEDHKKDQAPLSPMHTDISSNTASSNSSTNPIRVCSDCNTTKTPLWRSGPQGPKSLCNACGIRQRKARRALAEAKETSVMLGVKTKTKKQQKEKGSSTSTGHNVAAKFKKRRSKLTSDSGPTSSSRFEDLVIKLTNNLAHFDHHVFPQDEKEAAILLMALSCDRFLRSP